MCLLSRGAFKSCRSRAKLGLVSFPQHCPPTSKQAYGFIRLSIILYNNFA